MVFGRGKRGKHGKHQSRSGTKAAAAESEPVEEEAVDFPEAEASESDDAASVTAGGAIDFDMDSDGPFDLEDFDDLDQAAVARLDLGSVLIPVPDAGQMQVELTEAGVPSAIWVMTASGRFTIAAYAAPKTEGLWREVAKELADALRKGGAKVTTEEGPWGREVVGSGTGKVRFIGVDGYRWMVRCVVNGTEETFDTLTAEARTALADTVVRRGDTPMPVRTPLPVALPEPMAEQLRAAAAQQAAQQAAQGGQPPEAPQPAARRSAQGSAMQQLRSTMGS